MSEWVEKELRSNFARAIRAGHRAANTEPRATRVRYRALEDALRIELANGATIDNFQKGQFQGRTAFEGSWTQNGQTTTVIVADDGTVMSSSPTAAGRPPTAVTGSN